MPFRPISTGEKSQADCFDWTWTDFNAKLYFMFKSEIDDFKSSEQLSYIDLRMKILFHDIVVHA